MRVIISAAVSSDGYLDDTRPERLVLSGKEDWAEVYALRAECDAILVGAGTLRADNPALIIKDEDVRAQRAGRGMPADLVKVTVSSHGALDTSLRFFTERPGARKVVFLNEDAPQENIARLSMVSEVVMIPEITARGIIDALEGMGIRSLLVEGGAKILRMFFDENVADRIRIAVAPFAINEPDAPRLPYYGNLPFDNTAILRNVTKVGKMTVTDYIMHDNSDEEDFENLRRAVEVSRKTPVVQSAYSVGCVVVTTDGRKYAGYTHETSPLNHAEEEAFLKAVAAGADLRGASVYTSMEPCSVRKSKPVSCCELILRYGVARVVYAYAEPSHFVECHSTDNLQVHGVEVVVIGALAPLVREINSHILGE